MTNPWEGFRGKLKRDEPLAGHTTFGIGGPARFFLEPRDQRDLATALSCARRQRLRCLVIGAGSNILAPDRGLGAAVIRLNAPAFSRVSAAGTRLTAGAGCALSRLIRAAARAQLSGLEFLVGIPGTLGGALAMNAGQGSGGRWIGSVVESVSVMDSRGNVRRLKKRELKFAYRSSNLSGAIVTGAVLRLQKDKPEQIARRMREARLARLEPGAVRFPNAGCVFRNPAGASAGMLIDRCGLKGSRIGGAHVSMRHANFIVNDRGASASDVRGLIRRIQERVKARCGISLQPEIKLWTE